ncbi:uncharacterized protein MKK02DRAFT_42671 [Dioszegia hungarica]|uniref:Uncharacterized protein n=1 Tax=Dioszegia hungarica TaxID=4972 RepID=A0AA38LY35_9TREE|nr:uncharacterized protein MKK02DRAFT_42671 [Dioszegia hungarica]KAI9638281.1 hypothetical protein MKK02DRAFT_42671 [Dioszegia hungarica]
MAPHASAGKTPNVLPDWWAFAFMGLQAAALIPLTIQNVLDPNKMFKGLLPPGFDLATDGLNKSLRVEMAGLSSAHAFPMIASLFIGCTLFARNSLAGQPVLQQRLMKLPIYVGLFSDICLYAIQFTKLPSAVLYNPKLWTSATSGLLYGLPVATLLKLVWVFGIGRDVV